MRIDTPLFTYENGANPYEKEWERLKRLQKFAKHQEVAAKKIIVDLFTKAFIAEDTKGKIVYVGTCETYEVRFVVGEGSLHVMCIADDLRLLK